MSTKSGGSQNKTEPLFQASWEKTLDPQLALGGVIGTDCQSFRHHAGVHDFPVESLEQETSLHVGPVLGISLIQ